MAEDQDRARLLAQFQRNKPGLAVEVQRDDDDGEYHAFKAVDRGPVSLSVRSVSQASEWVTYQYLLRVVLGPRGRQLALIFSFMAITVKGKNLQQVAEAIADRRCDFIQEFDAKRWAKPVDPDAAMIEAITFIVDKAPMAAAEMMQEQEAA